MQPVHTEVHEEVPPPLFNFQAMLAEQGVPFFAGLPPPDNNVADSPMQAYHESMHGFDTSTDSESMIIEQGMQHDNMTITQNMVIFRPGDLFMANVSVQHL